MDKGIRPAVVAKFAELLPTVADVGYTAFRAEVNAFLMDEFGIAIEAAASHFNYARKQALLVPEMAALLEGKMRPADKLGGRKPKVKVVINDVVEEQQTEFAVYVKRTGEMVAEKLSFEAAQTLINRAAQQKKAKLYFL
jgi:hypothetical protein